MIFIKLTTTAYRTDDIVIIKKMAPPLLDPENADRCKSVKSSLVLGSILTNSKPLVCSAVVRTVNFVRPVKSPLSMVSLLTSHKLVNRVDMADAMPRAQLLTVVNMA